MAADTAAGSWGGGMTTPRIDVTKFAEAWLPDAGNGSHHPAA